jgi:hypothetical protein
MSRPSTPVSLGIEVCFAIPTSPDQIERTVLELQAEVSELNVESVAVASAEHVRPGGKGDGLTLAGLAIAVVPELIGEVLKLLFDWVERDPTRTIKIKEKASGPEYEITGRWTAEQLAGVMKVLSKRDVK